MASAQIFRANKNPVDVGIDLPKKVSDGVWRQPNVDHVGS